jgi:hypothetical protein
MGITSLTGQPKTPLRIDEIPIYVQLQPTDEGYVSPDNVWVVVGNVDFSNPSARKVALSSVMSFSTSHSEQARVTGLSSRTFSRTFNTAFTTLPVTSILKVYRMSEYETGKWEEVPATFHYTSANWKTITGFSITIDADESLTGLIVEYKFD